MREMKRAIHIDFHTLPGIDDFGENFTAAEIAKLFKDNHVRFINFFGRCNKGFSYYPTKIGEVYPTMKTNLLKDIIDECHKLDIGVAAYLNGCFTHEVILQHPEFAKLNKDGTKFLYDPTDNYHAYQQGCFNRPAYRQHLYEEIREMLEYGPDGIFCDCLMPDRCYCPECRAKMEEQGIDIDDDDAVFKFAMDTLYEVFAEIRAIVPEDTRLFLNSFPYEAISNYNTQAEIECLPTDGWGYEFYTAQAPYFRVLAGERDKLYMVGCFVDGWGDHGGKKSKAALENDIYDALIYGYTPSIGDHMHPRDGLNTRMYNEIGEAYKYVESLEPWTEKVKPYAEVAILRNKVTHKNYYNFLTDSDKGASRILAELKIAFDTVNEDCDFSKYRLLILPDDIQITDKLYEKLEAFDGSILSSGSSIREGKLWDYISEFEKDTNTHCFYKWNDEVCGAYNLGIRMKSDCSVIDYIEPYYNEAYDGRHYFFYVPPKDSIGYSVVAKSGNRAHISFNIFEAYLIHGAIFHKDLVNSLIYDLLDNRRIETDLPSTSRVTLAEGKDFDMLHVKVTYPEIRNTRGIIEEHTCVPAGRTVAVVGEYKKVRTLPDMKKVKSKRVNGRTFITLPEICAYQPFILEK